MSNSSATLSNVNGLAEKTQGLVTEIFGVITGNTGWKSKGRDLQKAGSKRLDALEREAKARKEQAAVKVNEQAAEKLEEQANRH